MTAKTAPRLLGTRDVYGDVLVELGREDPNLVVLTADLAESTRVHKFGKAYPERFFQMGVAEAGMVAAAAGLAASGKNPVVSTFAIFETARAFEQVRQDVCYPCLPVKLIATHGGVTVGPDGGSHQTIEDLALMRVLPKMAVVVPADGREAAGAVRAAVRHDGPIYVRLAREKFPVVLPEDYEFRLGRAALLREGTDVTIMACGILVGRALEAAEELVRQGIEARVLNVSTLKPIDTGAIVAAARDTGAIVTAEEHSIIGGLGSAVAEVLVEEYPVPMRRVGVRDRFGTSGSATAVLDYLGLTATAIVDAAHQVIERKACVAGH